MTEKTGQGVEVKELSSTSFGYVIGFLLPGLLGLYGLSLWSQDIQNLLRPAASTEAALGPSFFLLLSALTMGLIVSALRYFLFERWICKDHHLEPDMFAKLGVGEKLTAFKAVVDEHYRYHQFYGGCAVALLILFPKWLWSTWLQFSCFVRVLLIAAFIIFEVLMAITAKDSFIRYVKRGNTIVQG